MKVKFWGVRGTIPMPGPDTVAVGGNTTCVEVVTAKQYLIVLDAGTGIRNLGLHMRKTLPPQQKVRGTILFSHLHRDHIQGFPFFAPLFGKVVNDFAIIGPEPETNGAYPQTLEQAIRDQAKAPYLPFVHGDNLGIRDADMKFTHIIPGETLFFPHNTVVETAELDHPGGCIGYRITDGKTILSYCTDTTHADDILNDNVLQLAQNTHLLIHDAQYTPEQKKRFWNYGHSTYLDAAIAAKEANADALALTHHDPNACDDVIKQYVMEAREIFPRTFAARDGLELTLPIQEIPEW